jgi:acyl-[acyl-carrier-protein]-phospholipid O-acyltransferase / long-chain-fatty-acid--[acyl-carrier-protein] ligase
MGDAAPLGDFVSLVMRMLLDVLLATYSLAAMTEASPMTTPKPSRWSLIALLLVQAANAFGDNLVKLLIIGLALGVAAESAIGREMQVYLSIVFSAPYIVLAPLAGYLSDRFSKNRVVWIMQVLQLLCFIGFIFALRARAGEASLWWCLLLFCCVAVQSAIFSPARTGIVKELVGSAQLGRVNGLLQMLMMLGILAGIGMGGWLYKALRDRGYDAWDAALYPVYGCALLAALQVIVALTIQRTPEQPQVRYQNSLWYAHLTQLGAAFRIRSVGLAVSGMVFFWFMSYSVGTIMVGLGKELYPGDDAKATFEVSLMSGIVGIGVMLGGAIGGFICRKKIELGVVPLAGLGIAAALIVGWLVPMGSGALYLALASVGLCGGIFLVPLSSFVQDRAPPDERARILSAGNLLDCLIGGIGGNVLVWIMLKMGISSSAQLGVIGLISLGAAVYISRIVPKDMVRFVCCAILRSIYRIKSVEPLNVPREGGVLLLPNHVSYVDALVVAAACDRPVRFVMWDVLYRVWWMNGFLRLFGTVPISPTRAKDAIRTVSEALKSGEVVCLFPEGEITRTGPMGPLQKGFELMLRQAECPAVPVYLDGLWGSIFSYEGGTVFKKWPKKLRYPVVVRFGEAIQAREATTERVTQELVKLQAAGRTKNED